MEITYLVPLIIVILIIIFLVNTRKSKQPTNIEIYNKALKAIIDNNQERAFQILKDLIKQDENIKNGNEIINKINEVLDSKIRPAVARDGGDITFKSFKDGIVTVELKGSCSGCPSSVMTLKQGVQNLLCHYIPEVKSVEAI